MKKAVSTAMALSMMVGLMGVNASAYEAGSYDGVSITMLNTKSEIQDYLVDAAAEWGELTGASLDVYTISDSGSPSQEIAARYAANNAPTLIMGDAQVKVLKDEKTYLQRVADLNRKQEQLRGTEMDPNHPTWTYEEGIYQTLLAICL